VEALRDAWARKDAVAVAAALAPDATLFSPITAGLRFRGPAEIQEVLEAAYAVIDDGVQAELVAPGVLFVRGSVAGHAVEETILARPGAASAAARCCCA
jgi:ketosteroid isomerase-like protein